MPLDIVDRGKNNTLVLAGEVQQSLSGRVLLQGDNNRVEIGGGCVAKFLHVELGNSCEVSIGSGCVLGNLFVFGRVEGKVLIGGGSGFNGLVRLLLHEPGRVTIGKGCLFAGEIDITISDMHSIIDVETGARINPARDVALGDKVWVGQRAMLLKGSQIGAGSVIGACSVVNGFIPAQVLAAGVPARILRTGVTWRHDLI